MKNFAVLTEAIYYIEEHLCDPLTREEAATYCHVSLSTLEKLFRYALHLSIKEYISKRRMTKAAGELVQGGASVTDLAMKYQYNSVEVFSRAFKRVWNVRPSEFSGQWNFTGIFPKINYEYREGEDLEMARKKVDMSEAYDYLKERRGTCVLCFDIRNLLGINAQSVKAGDMVILETASRLDRAAGEDMLVMRIGGDEFALITGMEAEAEAQELAERILEQNGTPVVYEGKEYPLFLWCGFTRIPNSLRYSDFFLDLHEAIGQSKGDKG